jgi:hypothetical protein
MLLNARFGSAFTTYNGGTVKKWNAAFLTHAANLVNQTTLRK